MDKITIIIIALILLLPLVLANDYGKNKYGCGLYGIGCKVEEQAEITSPLLQGTNCDALSDANQRCYYLNASEGTCVLGCPEGYYCGDDYRCEEGKLVTKEIVSTILETTKENTKVIIAIGLVVSVVIVGIVAEEEHRKKKLLLAGKKEEEERKENQKKLPKVKKSKEEIQKVQKSEKE